MRKGLFFVASVFLLAFFLFSDFKIANEFEPDELAEKMENNKKRWEYEFAKIKNPTTGTIPSNLSQLEKQFLALNDAPQRTKNSLKFQTQGPTDLGGRTRSLAFDLLDPSGQTLLAGGVTSGVFRSTNGGASWTKVSPINAIHSVTSIVQDPTSPETWYFGTGELLGFAGRWGDGVWKSVDGGLTWFQLLSSASPLSENLDNSFDIVHRLAVDPRTGHLYAAIHRNILRSTDGGQSWETVLGTTESASLFESITDLVINNDGSAFFASFHGNAPQGRGGIWYSTTGDPDSWSRIAGGTPVNPPTWGANGGQGRAVMALAPGNQDQLYVLYDNLYENDCEKPEKPEADLFVYNLGTGEWQDRSANLPDEPGCAQGNNPFAVQGGYDLALAISPLDPNLVFLGGTSIFRSTNGFTQPNSERIGGYRNGRNYATYSNHHPDIHQLTFDPSDPTQLFSCSDGGIHRANAGSSVVVWQDMNQGFVTYQYYYVAQSAVAGDPRLIGGAQDNGTTLSENGLDHFPIFGGDGVSVGIGANQQANGFEGSVYYLGAQSGTIFRLTDIDGYDDIQPQGSGDEGLFITLFHLDPENTDLLYYVDQNRLWRTNTAPTVTSDSWQELTGVAATVGLFNDTPIPITALETSRGEYSSDSRLYFADALGRVYRIDDPAGVDVATVPLNITPPGVLERSYPSSIAVDPLDSDVVLVAYSSLGVPGLWLTQDGGSSWQNVEGNLDFPSKRAAAITYYEGKRVFLVGTTLGLWRADSVRGGATTWYREGVSDLHTAVISDLDYRLADGRLVVGTFGNGVFVGQFSPTIEQRLDNRYYLPEIQSDNNGKQTEITIVNPGNTTVELDLFGFDQSGNLLARSTLVNRVDAMGQLRFMVQQALPEFHQDLAWIQVASSAGLEIHADLITPTTRSAYRATQSNGHALMPHIAIDTAQFETVLSTVNTDNRTSDCFLTEHPEGLIFPLSDAFPPFAQSSKPITAFLGPNLADGPQRWGEVRSSNESLVAMEYFTRLPDRSQQAALGLDTQTGTTLNFLHVATDTNQFWTGMLYINTGDASTTATETFYNTDGQVLRTTQTPVAVDDKILLLFDFANQERVPAGTAWVQVTANQPLIGYELFGTPTISSNDTFAGLQGNYGGGTVLDYPYLISGDNAFTALVALNLGDTAASLSFTAYDANGLALETVELPNIPAKTKTARVVSDLFSAQTMATGAWVRATASGSEWAGFLLWGDVNAPRQFLSGINATAR